MIQSAPPQIPLPPLAPIRRKARWIALVMLVWLVVVLANYYTQIWQHLFQSSPAETIKPAGDFERLLYLKEALFRALKAVSGAGLALSSALSLGFFLGRLLGWRYQNWREGLPYTVALGIGVFSYSGFGLALVGLYRVEVLRALVALPLVAGLIWLVVHRQALVQRYRQLHFSINRPHPNVNWLWLSVIVVAVGLAFFAALAPEIEYDAAWYHLEYPRRFLESGHLLTDYTDFASTYPMTWELWFGFGLAMGGQITTHLFHFACLPLTGLVVYNLTKRYFSGSSPWLAVALFVTVPTLMWEASTAYIDLALTMHVALALYGVLRYLEKREQQWLLLGGLNLGLAVATKHTSLIFLGLICAGLTIRLCQTERNLWQVVKPVLIVVAFSLVLALPWYLRSFLATGNPVFPYLVSVFGAPTQWWDNVTDKNLNAFLQRFGPERSIPNLLTLPWHMTMHAAAYQGTFGPLFLIVLPGLVLQRWKRLTAALFAFVFLFLAIWASPLLSFQMRLVMPLAPVLAVLGAVAFARLQTVVRISRGRWGTQLLALIFAGLLVLNLPPFTALHETDRVGWNGWLTSVLHDVPWSVVVGGESEAAYLNRNIHSYAVWAYANQHLPVDAKVLTWTEGDQLYSARTRIWSNATIALPIVWGGAGNENQILRQMRQLGITHLIIDQRALDDSTYPILSEYVRTNWYEKLYEDYNYVLYRVRWENLPTPNPGA